MKKIYFSILFFMSFMVSSHAQIGYGVEAGMNMSYMGMNAPGLKISPLIAYRAGALLDIGVSDNINIQPGVYYTVTGYEYSYDVPGSTSDKTTVQENFIRVPINVAYKKPMGGSTFFITAGPYFGYGINGSVKAGGQTETFTFSGSNATDYGIGAGICYALPMGIFVRVGYERSLAGSTVFSSMGSQTNNCFIFSLGYLKVGSGSGGGGSHGGRHLPKPYNGVAFP